MPALGIEALYQKPNLSRPEKAHKKWPSLLRDLDINRPGQVWYADITYISMAKFFAYLVAVMDWHSRKVLSWRLSNTMETDFCVEALEEALHRHGVAVDKTLHRGPPPKTRQSLSRLPKPPW